MPIIDVRDEFTGGSGALEGRVPDLVNRGSDPSHVWTRLSGPAGHFQQIPSLAQARASTAGGPVHGLYTCGLPRSRNYRVTGTMGVAEEAAAAFYVRYLDATNYYAASFNGSSGAGTWHLVRSTGAGQIDLASGAVGVVALATFFAELEISGNRLKLWFDGTLLANVTDSSHPATGRPAVGASVRAGHIVNLSSYEVIDLTNPVRVG